jgi:hypothetical protein
VQEGIFADFENVGIAQPILFGHFDSRLDGLSVRKRDDGLEIVRRLLVLR